MDATAVLALHDKYRRQLRTTNKACRFIEEIRRRENVIRIFPNIEVTHRLVRAFRAEGHEEWSTGKRYLNMDAYFEWTAAQQTATQHEEETSAEHRDEPMAPATAHAVSN